MCYFLASISQINAVMPLFRPTAWPRSSVPAHWAHMNTLDRDPTAKKELPRTVEDLNERQQNAAESAATIGQFRHNWHEEVRDLLDVQNAGTDGASVMGDLRPEADRRTKEIDRAAEGNESLHLAKLGATTGGMAEIGGGEGGIVINQATPAALGVTRTAEDLRIAAAHEHVHAESVQLHGTLKDEQGAEIDPLLIHEGAAEDFSIDAEGGGKTQRADRPDAVYGEGQAIVRRIRATLGDGALKKTLMGDGDLSRLQPAFSRN